MAKPSPLFLACRATDAAHSGGPRSGRLAAKRGAGAPRLALDPEIALPQKREVDLVALDDA